MKLSLPSILALSLLTLATTAFAADSASEPKTLLAERGKLLLSDDFKEAPGKEWRSAKGQWELADGALRGAEIAEDKHGAVTRRTLPLGDAVLQYSFKLDGARGTSLSINAAKGHLCRVSITAAGFTVQKDDSDHEGPDKAVVFQKVATPIKAGEWHTLVIELLGQEMLATLDGQKTGYGAHMVIAGAKANLGFTVAGQTASFKNLRVWEAQPNKEWSANKAKLAAASAK